MCEKNSSRLPSFKNAVTSSNRPIKITANKSAQYTCNETAAQCSQASPTPGALIDSDALWCYQLEPRYHRVSHCGCGYGSRISQLMALLAVSLLIWQSCIEGVHAAPQSCILCDKEDIKAKENSHNYEEFLFEHQVTRQEAINALRSLNESFYLGPSADNSCKAVSCTKIVMKYCTGPQFINDHCWCELGHTDEGLPFVPHICYVGEKVYTASVGSCFFYEEVKECCCAPELAKQLTPAATAKPLQTPRAHTTKKQAFGDLKNIIGSTPSRFPTNKSAVKATPQANLRKELLRKRHLELNGTPESQAAPTSPKPGNKQELIPEEYEYFDCLDLSSVGGKQKPVEEIWTDMGLLGDDVFNNLLQNNENDTDQEKCINLGSILDALEDRSKPLQPVFEDDEEFSLDPLEIPIVDISDDELEQ